MKSEELKLCFFRNSINPNEYFLNVCTPDYAEKKADCLNHRNGMENSGYPHIPCEFIAVFDIPKIVYPYKNDWAKFIVTTFGKKTRDEPFLHELGWFEFSELRYSEEWLDSFFASQRKKETMLIEAIDEGQQFKLF